ncbi:TolC family protein [Mucilaginibacter dorajii]|uniref:Outer membrane efflux protein n=1 Tax=Mucilaginibacter dorajii TaxID=692994 RepID=A0ABP7R0I4_9SPHI|nr:TolC family protein [Mucilaginibacter dorajii]MCS3732290.1 outer membrane protein TolC [Mucilaginibacter dorajii]
MTRIIKKILLSLMLLIAGTLVHKTASAQQTLTLEQCRQLALERNNNLKEAQENINAAKAQKAQQDAGGKPTVDGTVTGFYFGKPLSSVLPQYGISPGLGITQPIYSGGKVKLNKAIAANGVEIQEEQKVLATSDVLYNTERAYWQVVSATEQIKLAEQSKKQLAALYTDLNNQYTAGTTYKNDVLRAKVQQNENELNLTRAHDNLTLAKLNLAQITGLGDSTNFIITDSVRGSFNATQNNAELEKALINRSEIKILQKSILSDKMQEKLLIADLKPVVSLGVNGVTAFGKKGINPTNNNNFMATYYSMLNVNIPIFDWGRKRQTVKEQRYKTAAKGYQLKERTEQVSLEVQQAYLQLNQSVKRIGLSGISLQQAEENLRLSNDRFKAGTIIGKDVLEAQTIWQQAYSDLIDAKVEYKINEANLKRALGQGINK